MKVSEYRDLISAVQDQIASLKSAADDYERDSEARRLIRLHEELSAAVCPRATARDKAKAARIVEEAHYLAAGVLMAVHDNQAIEAGESYFH